MEKPVVFISYSNKDEYWKDKLVTHLKVLKQEGFLDIWDDSRIGGGEEWYGKIQEAIKASSVAILLISADFLTSKFIRSEEVPLLLERCRNEGLRIIPVLIKPCTWKQVEWLVQMNLRPKGRAISGGEEHQIDADLATIAEEVADIINEVETRKCSMDISTENVSITNFSSSSDCTSQVIHIKQQFDDNFERLPRRIYKERIIKAMKSHPKSLRAVLVGPHFLEPNWIIQKRLKRDGRRESFAFITQNYLKESIDSKDREIKLILRNDIRYLQILESDIEKNQINDLIREMKSNLNFIFSESSFISIHCLDPGNYFPPVIITNKSCFVPCRRKWLEPIEEGIENKDPDFIRWQVIQFENFFDKNYKGPTKEKALLENYITQLEFFLIKAIDKSHSSDS